MRVLTRPGELYSSVMYTKTYFKRQWGLFLLAPELRESIQEVLRFEKRWEVVDLNDVAKVTHIQAHVLVCAVVIVNVLNGKNNSLFQIRLDLTETQNKWVQSNGKSKK